MFAHVASAWLRVTHEIRTVMILAEKLILVEDPQKRDGHNLRHYHTNDRCSDGRLELALQKANIELEPDDKHE